MHLYTFDLPNSLQMGELKVVYKLPEFGLFGSAGHRLKKKSGLTFPDCTNSQTQRHS